MFRGGGSFAEYLAPHISDAYGMAHDQFLMYSTAADKSCSQEEIKKLDREFEKFWLEELDHEGIDVRDLKLFERGLQRFRNHLHGAGRISISLIQ